MSSQHVRMACLKLARGDATPRTLEIAAAHVAVAKAERVDNDLPGQGLG